MFTTPMVFVTCIFVFWIQGLGLLINLVEYSSRNRHCLVEMEVDTSCLVGPEKDVKKETEDGVEGENKKEGEENKLSTLESLNALVALVEVCLDQYLTVASIHSCHLWILKCLNTYQETGFLLCHNSVEISADFNSWRPWTPGIDLVSRITLGLK